MRSSDRSSAGSGLRLATGLVLATFIVIHLGNHALGLIGIESMESEMEQLQRLATLGTAAGMIAHEVRGLLTPVRAYAQLALKTADRGYVIETGKIILEGPADELLSNPEVQEAYLGI